MPMINIFQPDLGDEELAAVKQVFRSNWIGRGDAVMRFERAFAAALGADPGCFTSTTCCTEGLFLAPRLFGLGAGDEVIVPSCSFVAVGSAVLDCGARLVFCDVDPRSMNVTAAHIAAKLTSATKAVIVTHYGGHPCDMDAILSLCRPRGVAVIEDAACALGSTYHGRACGTLADLGTWSFDAMKMICTGDGGMIYAPDPPRVEIIKEHLYLGLPNKQKSGMDSSNTGAANWWEFQINRPGRRAIMNNIAGAIGEVQLGKLPRYHARRRQVYDRYLAELTGLDWLRLPPAVPAGCVSSCYFFWIQTDPAVRQKLARHLLEGGVYATYRYWPLHKVDFFRAQVGPQDLPGADEASERTLNLPVHQSLGDADVDKVIALLKAFSPTA